MLYGIDLHTGRREQAYLSGCFYVEECINPMRLVKQDVGQISGGEGATPPFVQIAFVGKLRDVFIAVLGRGKDGVFGKIRHTTATPEYRGDKPSGNRVDG